jgi:hypothetical protein
MAFTLPTRLFPIGKVDATPEEALTQIEDKGYAIAYEAGHRQVVKVGVSYDKETRGIAGWKVG